MFVYVGLLLFVCRHRYLYPNSSDIFISTFNDFDEENVEMDAHDS
jgi:hypothetical protein